MAEEIKNKEELITITINGRQIQTQKGIPVIAAADAAGIEIPRLCYHADFYRAGTSGVGSCGLCVVKNNATGKVFRSCLMKTAPGMDISTEDKECKKARKTALQLILANHPLECLTCIRNTRCELQTLAAKMNIREIPYISQPMNVEHDSSSTSIHINPNKCIKCGRCVVACKVLQQVEALEVGDMGHTTQIRAVGGLTLEETPCIKCGQCTAHCPVAGIYEKDHVREVWEALDDSEIHTVVQIAPAVRVAFGEEFGLEAGTLVTGKIYAVLRRLGFDKIFDTNFGADITIMEEAAEFAHRFVNEPQKLPVITSCCPSWVDYCEKYYPNTIENLSSSKSPHQMFGAMVKSYYAERENIDPAKIRVISVMPCTSKKYEIGRHEDMFVNGYADVDIVITTRELARMVRESGIDFLSLPEEEADQLMGEYSGAGTIFGATGGVLEAALRTAYYYIFNEDLPDSAVEFQEARGLAKNKVATINMNDREVRVAVAHGIQNVKAILNEVEEAKAKGEQPPYDLIEIMACYGGCIGGGGQPYVADSEIARQKRIAGLYVDDKNSKKRRSHTNPMIQQMYKEYIGEPLGERAHHLLHTHFAQKPIIRSREELLNK